MNKTLTSNQERVLEECRMSAANETTYTIQAAHRLGPAARGLEKRGLVTLVRRPGLGYTTVYEITLKALMKTFQVTAGVPNPCFACNEPRAIFHYQITRIDGAVIEDQVLCAACCVEVVTGVHDLETDLTDITEEGL